MPYLIDGHNLIAHLPDIDLADPDDEARLVLKLRGFAARQRQKITVIFDEGLPGGRSSMSNFSVQVIFAASRHTSADRVLIERIREIPDPANWTIVTSDNEILATARQRGLRTVRASDFARRLQAPPRPSYDPSTAADIRLSEDEIAQWLAIFKDDP